MDGTRSQRNPPTHRATVRDVAHAAGVSPSTVSLCLNGKGAISDATRARVLQTAKDVGYRVNPIARRLRGGGSNVICLSIRSLDDEGRYRPTGIDYYFRTIGSGATTALDLDYGLIVGRPGTDGLHPLPLWVDGYVFEDPLENDAVLRELRELGSPVVTIGRIPGEEEPTAPYVVSDHLTQTSLLLDSMLTAGSRRPVMIGSTQRVSWHIETENAYRIWCEKHNVDPEIVRVEGWDRYSQLDQLTRALLSHETPPDGLLLQNGFYCERVLPVVEELGIKIPGELTIAAASDAQAAQAGLGVTAIDLRPEELARHAVELLVEILREPGTTPASVCVPGKLLLRASTG